MPTRESLTEAIDRLSENSPEAGAGFKNQAADIDRKRAELEPKADKFAQHAEVMKGYKEGLSTERINICKRYIEEALERESNTMGRLSELHQLEKPLSNALYRSAELREATKGEPLIDYIPITKSKKTWSDWLHNRPATGQEKTDEVLVLLRFNNNTKPSETTVVMMAAKVKNGRIQMGEGADTLTRIVSEKELIDMQVPELGNSAEARMARGEITMAEYREQFKAQNADGVGLQEYWKKRDEEMKNSPNRKEVEESQSELFKRLEGVYAKQLEGVLNEEQNLFNEFREVNEMVRKRNEKAVNSKEFEMLVESVLTNGLNEAFIAYFLESMISSSGITKESITVLMADIIRGLNPAARTKFTQILDKTYAAYR